MSESSHTELDAVTRRAVFNLQMSNSGQNRLSRALRGALGVDQGIDSWIGMETEKDPTQSQLDDAIHAMIYDAEPEALYSYARAAVDEAVAHNRLDAAWELCNLFHIQNATVSAHAQVRRAERDQHKKETIERAIAGAKFDLDGLKSPAERLDFLRHYFLEGNGRSGAAGSARNATEREMWIIFRALTVADYYHDKKATKSGAALGATLMELRSSPGFFSRLSPELQARVARDARAKIANLLESSFIRDKREGRDLAGLCLDVGLLNIDDDAGLLDRATK